MYNWHVECSSNHVTEKDASVTETKENNRLGSKFLTLFSSALSKLIQRYYGNLLIDQ